MKKDVFNHNRFYEKWKGNLTPKYIEEGLTKPNSDFFVNYNLDLAKETLPDAKTYLRGL